MDMLTDRARKGRGAVSNRAGRFEALNHQAIDDGWWQEPELPPLATTVAPDASRSVIARNESPDIPFDQSVNPYRGCEHGCIYCFARPSHAWLGLSPGLDFETRLFAKHDAARLLRRELAARGYVCKVITLGANTDPYQPVEGRLRLTRGVLEVLAETRHPVVVVTKSDRVTADLDLLRTLAEDRLVQVFLSITTLDGALARVMEPRAAQPARRLKAVERLAQAGVPVGVLAAPMIPAINDHELEAILAAAAAAGAGQAGYTVLRLPLEIAGLFEEWLRTHFPDRAERVLGRMRGLRGGRLYDSAWGQRMRGSGPEAELLRARFRAALARYGLNRRDWQLDTTRFRKPGPEGQLSLL